LDTVSESDTASESGTADLVIANRPGGQPFLPRRPELAVSLSADGDWLAAAVGIGTGTGTGIGIDVQSPQRVSAGRLGRCGSPAARIALAALPDAERDLEYARIWAVQEACVKAAGSGLAGRPWRIPVEVGQFHGRWRDYRWLSVGGLGVPVGVAFGPSAR
jgi:4'-phosphopantetheinyl transferase